MIELVDARPVPLADLIETLRGLEGAMVTEQRITTDAEAAGYDSLGFYSEERTVTVLTIKSPARKRYSGLRK